MKTHMLLTLLFMGIVTSTATAQEFTFSGKGKLKGGGMWKRTPGQRRA